jgi:2-oxoglutarate dehydrogenase E2 component (dihydrolipoamide succinyltransferase)
MIDIVLPTDQSEGTSNVVGRWFRKIGDQVRLNDPLLEITTDKVTVEIAAPAAGVLAEILKQEGDAVEPGDIVGRIEAGDIVTGDAVLAPGRTAEFAPPTAAAPDAETISPAVRRLLKAKGLDPSQIQGTGKGGRITAEDVERHAGRTGEEPGKPGKSGENRGTIVPHSSMRRSIAEHMLKSVSTAPHVTAVFEADLSRVLAHREFHGKVHTLTAYFVRATVAALQAVPEVNSRWHDHGLELFSDCNIGIATAIPGGGLIVPVIHQAQTLDLAQTAGRLAELTERARTGKLDPRQVQGGTFTISNHGVSGSLLAAPIIINQPQSAILGIGKVEQRVKVDRGSGFNSFTALPMAYVTLTIDHRALDGFQANAFLTRWVEAIEQWS